MNFGTMPERLRNNPKQFIEGFFRMHLENDQNNWYLVRVTQVSGFSEKAYIYTIQSMQDHLNYWLDTFITEHPEALQ
jgi:hypothetical protein